MAVSTFGIGAPINPAQLLPIGSLPYGFQGLSLNPYAAQQAFTQPVSVPLSPSVALNTYVAQPLQQLFQVLQNVPQQLQQLQQLVFVQQQQLQQVQQLLQLIPGQLVQLQQLIQLVPQQIQQLYASQVSGVAGFGLTQPWGLSTQAFAQPGHVM